jgi:hypothetical protein
MKKLIGLLLLAVAAPAHAVWEFPSNPDRFPSFGVKFSGQHLDGERHEMDSPNPLLSRDQVGPINSTYQTFGGDFRLPFNESATVTFGIDSIRATSHFTRQDAVYHEKQTQEGWNYSVGLRVYINR